MEGNGARPNTTLYELFYDMVLNEAHVLTPTAHILPYTKRDSLVWYGMVYFELDGRGCAKPPFLLVMALCCIHLGTVDIVLISNPKEVGLLYLIFKKHLTIDSLLSLAEMSVLAWNFRKILRASYMIQVP